MKPKTATCLALATAAAYSLIRVTDGAFVSQIHTPLHSTMKPAPFTKTSMLHMSKNSDRAHTERVLEDMMGDDWRVFRAKLVAQEQAEARDLAAAAGSLPSGASGHQDEKQPLHHFVVGALSSLFGSTDPASSLTACSSSDQKSDLKRDTTSSKNHTRMVYVGGSPVPLEDPFASEEELPLMMEPKFVLDKHRWAHPIGHVEPGCVLIANEKLGGVFHQTVVLIIDHHENSGSTGIVINRLVG